jgi:hypothetical protein
MSKRKWLLGPIILAGIIFVGAYCSPALASDSDIKAAFIYNIIKYASWPESTLQHDGHLVLCYVGAASALSESIANLHGKHVDAHTIDVRNTTRMDNLESCHVVVLGQDLALEALHRIVTRFALTVGEGESFVAEGGGVGLFQVGDRIRFDVNLDASHGQGVRISAQVLRLARNVRGQQ